ncbi:30S ribosomal protein S8 [Candidatus Uhrbacteria bacterium]|nr:30S ribosomal protein S8 [Candidatus Uhrbacteria bacterium]
MMTDPIADMLTRIRNAQAVKKPDVTLPYSRIKFAIAQILREQGLLARVEEAKTEGEQKKFSPKQLHLVLQYDATGASAITHLRRISKPGRRSYVGKTAIPTVLNNLGIAILSTSQGLMTNREAKKKGLGGELICEIW